MSGVVLCYSIDLPDVCAVTENLPCSTYFRLFQGGALKAREKCFYFRLPWEEVVQIRDISN